MKQKDFAQLISQAKNTTNNKITQKLVPVKKKKENEIQFSFYIDKGLLKQLKIKALEKEKSIKSIINDSIKQFLEKQ